MFGTKHSKTNRLQKTIECKTNEQSTKYSYWAIPEKIQTGVGVEEMEFPAVLKKDHVEIPGVN